MYIMILSIMYYFTNFGDLCDSGSFHLYGFPGSTTHYDKKFILLLLTSFISEIKLFLFLFLHVEDTGKKSAQLLATNSDYILLSSFNSKSQIDVAILDFSKAFDTVPHAGLLGKLEHYGIDSKILLWITNFLNNRKQRVVVDGSFSNYADVESGVPQGTVLGPLLFLLHINDLPSCVNSKVRLFADDCLLYREIKNNQDQIDMQRDLDALMDWGSTWGMKFNAKKCNIMRVSRSRKPLQHFYSLG